MNSSVIIGIKHFQCLGVKLKSCYRAAKNCPQFLVKFTQMLYVLSALNVNAVLSTYSGKLPFIFAHKHLFF